MIDEHFKLWTNKSTVDFYTGKNATQFFPSETHFLGRTGSELASVLDVGCACGRFRELLTSLGISARFTGLDIVSENIEQARRLYPDCQFHVGDATVMELPERYDLVNATGVFQHVPAFPALLERMVSLSDRYVLFDVKFAAVDDHLVDIERSYSEKEGKRAYFICLNYHRFLLELQAVPGIAAIDIFGYRTPRNQYTVVPEGVEPLVSAGILLTKGSGRIAVNVDLAEDARFITSE